MRLFIVLQLQCCNTLKYAPHFLAGFEAFLLEWPNFTTPHFFQGTDDYAKEKNLVIAKIASYRRPTLLG